MNLPPIDVELLRTIADDLPLAIWLGAVPGGELIYVNKAFNEVLGMGPPPDASRNGSEHQASPRGRRAMAHGHR